MSNERQMPLSELTIHIQEIWRAVLPHIPEPQLNDIVFWYGNPVQVIEAAIVRAGAKFRKDKIPADAEGIDPIRVYRYITGFCRAINAGERAAVRHGTA